MDLLFPSRLAATDLRTSESFDCEQCFGHGPYQRRMLSLVLLGTFMVNCQTIVVSLVTGDVDHWCKPPDGFNISAAEWKHIAIPMETDGRFSRCRIYERCKPPAKHDTLVKPQDIDAVTPAAESWYNRCFTDQDQDINSTHAVPCEAWDYDPDTAESSAISTWNMVCDRRLMGLVLVSMPIFGSVVGLWLVGLFADYIGRRTLLLGSAIVMLTCTMCTLVVTEYIYYTMAYFLAGCSVAVNGLLCYIVPFESMTHAHRPQQVLFLGIVSFALSEVWTIVIKPIVLYWRLKQAVFLAPGALLLPALCFARESPRWLVAKGRLDEAEAVMMRAATINNFPLPATACLMEKLKENLKKRAACENVDRGDLLDVRSHPATSAGHYKELWVPAFTVVIMLLAYVVMHYLITGVTLVTVLSVCFVIIGCMQCALCVAATFRLDVLTKAFLVLSKGVSNVFIMHCLTYVMELFPSALRGSLCCYSFGFCRLAALIAVLVLVLQPAGYEDVVLAMTALCAFGSLLVIRDLPKMTVVEEAKIMARDPTDCNRMRMDHMKRTLEGKTLDKRTPVPSRESTRSSHRRRLKRTGCGSSGGSKACPQPGTEQVPE
ncbi:hypothetical protein MTO96_012387 [Rhipicephalus appendiculatus]